MKNIAVLLLVGLLVAVPAFADEVDDALPASADNALKAHTRAMLQAGVDSDQGLQMTRAMLQNQYQNRHIIQAQKTVMQAARQGTPTEPVMNKAQEGIAKSVAPERVVQAMEQVQNRYANAHQVASQLNLNARAKHQTGNLMAEAMAAGMTEDAGNRIMEQIQARVRTLNHSEAGPLAVQTAMTTREMARRGVDADTTAEVVCQALQNQFQAREMAQLRLRFRDQAQQKDPQQLAHQLSNQFQHGQHSGSLGNAFGQGGGGSNAGSGSDGSGSGSGGSGDSGGGSGGGGSGGGGSGGGGSGGGGSGGGGGGGGR